MRSQQLPNTRISNGSVGSTITTNLSIRSLLMLFSISEKKVAAVLKASPVPYPVFTSEVPAVRIENFQPTHSLGYAVTGVVYASPAMVTAEARSRVGLARRRIEESGVPLKTADELTREINVMRGRH